MTNRINSTFKLFKAFTLKAILGNGNYRQDLCFAFRKRTTEVFIIYRLKLFVVKYARRVS
jgi:hypothetical protein